NAIAGYDPDDPASVNIPTRDYSVTLDESLSGLRFAALRGYFNQEVDEEILRAVGDAERVLAGLSTLKVEKELAHAEEMFEMNRGTLRVEAATYHRDWLETRVAEYGADVYSRLKSYQAIRADEYALARRRQAEL